MQTQNVFFIFSRSAMTDFKLPVRVGWAIQQISPLIPYVTKSFFLVINNR